MPDYADTAAKRFSNAIAEVQSRVGDLFITLKDLPPAEIIAALESVNISATITGLLEPELARLEAAYKAGLELLTPYGQVAEGVLEALVRIDMEVYVGQVGATATELQRLIARSVLTNASETQFAKELLRTGLQPHQANALANDSLRKYQRQVKDQMAQSAAPDKLYVNEGPNDDKTSDECLAALAAGPMTRAEWESNFPGYFTNGGHFGCRHSVEPYVRESQEKAFSILPGAA